MPQIPGPETTKSFAAHQLRGPARAFHRFVLEHFVVAGRPPGRDQLASAAVALDASAENLLAELTERDVVALDADGEIRAAYPFSPTPTQTVVGWEGGPKLYAMCAIDALGVSAMISRPVTVVAAEPDSQAPIVVAVDGRDARWDPVTAVVFVGRSGADCRPSVDRTCRFVNLFTTPGAAAEWGHRHPEIRGSIVDRQTALDMGAQEFGDLLQ